MKSKSRESDGTAAFSGSHYCRNSRNLLRMLGLWPHQNPLEQTLKTVFLIFCLTLPFITMVLKLRQCHKDFEVVVEIIAPMSVLFSSYAKVVTLYKNRDKLRLLLNEVDRNWKCLQDKREIELLEKNMKIGKFHGTVYMIYIYGTVFLFIVLIFEPVLLDIVAPLNESRPLKPAYPSDYYFLNEQDHFPMILCHTMFTVLLVVTIMTAVDSMYIMYVRCGCSLFSIVGHRFEWSIYENSEIRGFSVKSDGMKCKQRMAIAVPSHNQAFMYIQQLESIFSIPCTFQIGVTVVCLIFTLMESLILLGRLEMIRFTFFAGGSLFHLFCYYYQGQLVQDQTQETAYKIYSGPWYNAPNEIQKALLFVLQRSGVLSRLTAGKVMFLSIENYGSVVKNCMSYFTVLASFR